MTMYAKILPMPATLDPQRVALVVYDRLATFEFGIAVEVFGLRRPDLGVPWYRFQVCAIEPGPIRARGGVVIGVEGGLGTLRRAGTIVIPGWRSLDERPPEPFLRALVAAHARGARIVTICTGAFVVAAAGLADGRRVTTHWMHAEALAARYPRVRVDSNVLFVDEGRILTSAGAAAGIDLCLHVVRTDYGAEVASTVARRMVTAPQREGGQAQFVPAIVAPTPDSSLAPLLEWIQKRLAQHLPVAQLARRAAMSPRTFARRFREVTGTTPHRWIVHQRVLAAQQRLEASKDSVDRVAEVVGLRTAVTLRHHFAQILGTSPTAYRRRFASPAAPRRR
ncbi:MAG: transcriptional regulator FtrA [Vicinamibacterales bacterium]